MKQELIDIQKQIDQKYDEIDELKSKYNKIQDECPHINFKVKIPDIGIQKNSLQVTCEDCADNVMCYTWDFDKVLKKVKETFPERTFICWYRVEQPEIKQIMTQEDFDLYCDNLGPEDSKKLICF